MTPSRTRGFLLAGLTSLLWGTVPVAAKIALAGLTPPALSFVRLLAAGVFMGLLLRGRGERARPPPIVWIAGLGLAGNYTLFAWGVELEGAGTSQILIQLASLFLVVLSIVFLRERPTPRQYLGAALAVAGAVIVKAAAARTGAPGPLGVIVLMVAALLWAMYAVIHKRIGREVSSGRSMTWIFLAAAVFSAPAAAVVEWRSPDTVQLAAAAYLVLNTVVAYWAFAESLRHIDASEAAVITTLGPVFTVVALSLANRLRWKRIGYEPLDVWKLVGAALVVAGVMCVVTARRRGGGIERNRVSR